MLVVIIVIIVMVGVVITVRFSSGGRWCAVVVMVIATRSWLRGHVFAIVVVLALVMACGGTLLPICY